MAKNKKRSRTANQMRQERLAEEKDRNKKRMDPTARSLLLGDLVFLAVISMLDAAGILSDPVNALCTVIGAVLLVAALWFQFGRKRDGGAGPRL